MGVRPAVVVCLVTVCLCAGCDGSPTKAPSVPHTLPAGSTTDANPFTDISVPDTDLLDLGPQDVHEPLPMPVRDRFASGHDFMVAVLDYLEQELEEANPFFGGPAKMRALREKV